MANEKRLIDAWDLIEWLDEFNRENTLRVLRGKKAKLLNSHEIKNMIVTVPRVDAVEVVRGRWLEMDWGGIGVPGFMACSNCNVMIPTPEDNRYCLRRLHYCPNCGASMMDGDGND